MDLILSWEKSANTDYYIVLYGTTSGAYTKKTGKIVNPDTECVFVGLPEKDHYFVVKAHNDNGQSSPFSDEVSNGPLPGVVTSVVVKTCVTYEAR